MASLSLTVLPAKALKDGRHKVRIAVAHNSKTRYILTDVVLDSINEWKNGRVVRRPDAAYLNTKLNKQLNDMQEAIDEVPYIEGLSCSELIESMNQTRQRKTHTLESAFEEMLEVSTAKLSTQSRYRQEFKSITKTLPAKTLVQHVTPLMVRRLIKVMESTLQPVTARSHLTLLAQIFNYCQRNGYTEFRVKPTDGMLKGVVAIRQNWLTPDQVRFIRDTETGRRGYDKFRDLFMLSYYLGGINAIDLARINFNECRDTIHYVRSKTERKVKVNPFVEFDIPEVAKPIIERYKRDDGTLDMYDSNKGEQSHTIGYQARRYREKFDLPGMTYYSARKSFAQHAFALGESESVIDYILGHSLGAGNNRMLFAYIKVTPAMATACIKKVCDFIAGTEKFD